MWKLRSRPYDDLYLFPSPDKQHGHQTAIRLSHSVQPLPLATQRTRTKGYFLHEPSVPNLICWPGSVSSIPVRRGRPGEPMTITLVGCSCGIVEVQLTGEPIAQYVCHCDDCQAVHGKAYPVALYADSAVVVTRGEVGASILKTTPRIKCSGCGTYVFAEVPRYPFRGVNGDLLPHRRFKPEFHVHCQYAATRIDDSLPHYRDTPVQFCGSGEIMSW